MFRAESLRCTVFLRLNPAFARVCCSVRGFFRGGVSELERMPDTGCWYTLILPAFAVSGVRTGILPVYQAYMSFDACLSTMPSPFRRQIVSQRPAFCPAGIGPEIPAVRDVVGRWLVRHLKGFSTPICANSGSKRSV